MGRGCTAGDALQRRQRTREYREGPPVRVAARAARTCKATDVPQKLEYQPMVSNNIVMLKKLNAIKCFLFFGDGFYWPLA
jgi:hypothetical protein